MDKILSQDEVDALLRGVTGGEVDTTPEPEEPTDGPVPYDLGNQEWIVRGRMPTLDIIHQQFARLFRMSLGEALRKPVEVTVTPGCISVTGFVVLYLGVFQSGALLPKGRLLHQLYR